jgi:hypothetical protein
MSHILFASGMEEEKPGGIMSHILFASGMEEEKPGGKEDELEEFIKAGRTGRR